MTGDATTAWKTGFWRLGWVLVVIVLHGWAATQASIRTRSLSAPMTQATASSVAISFVTNPQPAAQRHVSDNNQMNSQNLSEYATPTTRPAEHTVTPASVDSLSLKPEQSNSQLNEEAADEPPTLTSPTSRASQPEPSFAGATPNLSTLGAHNEPLQADPVFLSPPKSPRYPTIARKRGQQGTVWLEVWLNARGEQTKVSVSKSSGFEVLDDSAITAVAQWEFFAPQQRGITVASRMVVPVEFSLN